MMQTVLSRLEGFLSGFLSPLMPPDEAHRPVALSEIPESADEDRLPERDESYYWAMYTHW